LANTGSCATALLAFPPCCWLLPLLFLLSCLRHQMGQLLEVCCSQLLQSRHHSINILKAVRC
jgi:hypothetical protein